MARGEPWFVDAKAISKERPIILQHVATSFQNS